MLFCYNSMKKVNSIRISSKDQQYWRTYYKMVSSECITDLLNWKILTADSIRLDSDVKKSVWWKKRLLEWIMEYWLDKKWLLSRSNSSKQSSADYWPYCYHFLLVDRHESVMWRQILNLCNKNQTYTSWSLSKKNFWQSINVSPHEYNA